MARQGDVQIDWTVSGTANLFEGVAPTPAERWMAWGISLSSPAVLYLLAWQHQDLGWVWWQWLLAALICVDLVGGTVSNTLNSGKRYFFAAPLPGETGLRTVLHRMPILFTAVHIHSIGIAWLYGGSLAYAVVWYLAPLLGAVIVHRVPLYLARPTAFTLLMVAVLVNVYVIEAPAGFEWFVPLLFLKLVCGHSLREEPYRP